MLELSTVFHIVIIPLDTVQYTYKYNNSNNNWAAMTNTYQVSSKPEQLEKNQLHLSTWPEKRSSPFDTAPRFVTEELLGL